MADSILNKWFIPTSEWLLHSYSNPVWMRPNMAGGLADKGHMCVRRGHG